MTIKKLVAKIPTPIRLHIRSAWWLLRRALGLRERIPSTEKLSVVLLSYRRMKNLRYIVESLLLCEFVEEIVLSNNNPEVKMEDFVCVRDSRLRIINQPVRCFPSMRYELARELSVQYFLSIDDDLFLTPRQIRKLFQKLIENPSVPHGAGGEDFVIEDGEVVSRRGVCEEERETDVILWAYAFTCEHVTGYFRLLDQLRIANADLTASEDVIISFAGKGRPRCENLGSLLSCKSAQDPKIATWMQDGFLDHRCHLYLQCRERVAPRGGM